MGIGFQTENDSANLLAELPQRFDFRLPTFCGLHRTEVLIQNPQIKKLLHSFFLPEEISEYHSTLDLLFCKIFPEWSKACFAYYSGRGERLSSFSQVSPKNLLEWDAQISDIVLPRLKSLYLKGRRRWASVEKDLRVPAPPRNRVGSPTQNLPLSLKMNHHCSTALELARLRGTLCRNVHELVESVRWEDEIWFRRSMDSIKSFVAAVPQQVFGTHLASKILAERLEYVQSLPHYGSLRARFSKMMESYRLQKKI